MIRRLLKSTEATAAVETAIFAPIFVVLTLGITDLGAGMFVRIQVNAAAQAGAAYAVIHGAKGATCFTLTAGCRTAIYTAMDDAAGNPSFCTGSVCNAFIQGCADGSPKCIIVTASYPYTPILGDAVYAWGKTQTVSATATIRIL